MVWNVSVEGRHADPDGPQLGESRSAFDGHCSAVRNVGDRRGLEERSHECAVLLHQAVNAWLSLHEAAATQRAYRKEAERLILWAIVERGKPLSSLTTEDAIAYRAFLRHPAPRASWIGPPCPRPSPEWRPIAGALLARSAAYALCVLGALFRWLIEQRYVLAKHVRRRQGPPHPTGVPGYSPRVFSRRVRRASS